MKKKIIIAFIAICCLLQAVTAKGNKEKKDILPELAINIPYWVQQPPSSSDRIYFVGKSERAGNYKNYLEAKAGALMDILTQFSIYKGANVNYYLQNYGPVDISSVSVISKIVSSFSSTGLYQQSEWMADDGCLHVLYAYSLDGIKNPMPDYFENLNNFQIENKRIYFTAMSVSPYNTGELPVQAEQNAKMQALLWLGVDIKEQLSMHLEENFVFYEGLLQGKSKTNLESLSFREEARYIQKEQDNKYHFYGLYSINDTIPESLAEYECLTYALIYNNDNSRESFNKDISFIGYRFLQDKPFPALKNTKITGKHPLNGPFYENYFIGILEAENTSVELGNIMTTMHTCHDLAGYINTVISSMIREEKGNDGIIYYETFYKSQISSTISNYKKNHEVVSEDGTLWQTWEISRDELFKLVNKVNNLLNDEKGNK